MEPSPPLKLQGRQKMKKEVNAQMLETKQKEKREVICYHCHHQIDTLIAIKKQKLFRNGDWWEAINSDSSLKFYCPHCGWEVDIDLLGIKKVKF